MKKLCLLVALVGMMTSCDIIKIVVNSTNAAGERRVMTSSPSFFRTDGYDVTIAMGAKMAGSDTLAALVVTCDAPVKTPLFEVGHKMHFRLKDGETIVLTNLLDREYESHTEAGVHDRLQSGYGYAYSFWGPYIDITPYHVTTVVPEVYFNEVNNSYAVYPITYNQLYNIVTKGVSAVRIQTNTIDLDMPYTDKVAGLLHDLAVCLIDGIYDKNRIEY